VVWCVRKVVQVVVVERTQEVQCSEVQVCSEPSVVVQCAVQAVV